MHTHAPGSKLNKCYITFTHLRVASFDRDDERCVLEGRVSGIDVGSSNLQHSRNTHSHAPQRGVLFHGEKQRGVTSRSLRAHLKNRKKRAVGGRLGEDTGSKRRGQRERQCWFMYKRVRNLSFYRQSTPKSIQSLSKVCPKSTVRQRRR